MSKKDYSKRLKDRWNKRVKRQNLEHDQRIQEFLQNMRINVRKEKR